MAVENRTAAEISDPFALARRILPEEIKRRLNAEIQRLRLELKRSLRKKEPGNIEVHSRLEKEIRKRRKRIEEELGGDTDETTLRVLKDYRPGVDSSWFVEGFKEVEEGLFRDRVLGSLQKRFARPGDKEEKLPIDELVIDDRGMGGGRSLRMILRIVQEREGITAAKKLAKRLHGIDLIDQNIVDAYADLREWGVPGRNLRKGNYLHTSRKRINSPGHKAHLIVCMMHSAFHCVTEEDWLTFFKRARADLLPGGLLVFDTVGMVRSKPKDFEDSEAQAKLHDLMNLYTQLWKQYCSDNQHLMASEGPDAINLLHLPRYPIRDNTTGKGFYQREVPQSTFLDHIIKQIGGGLRMNTAIGSKPIMEDDERARQIGRDWIVKNGLDAKYRAEIEERIRAGLVDPGAILRRTISAEEKLEAPAMEQLLDHIAIRMVRGYLNLYYVYERC